MQRIRPFSPGDEPALASICLRTAASGGDATGLLEDDEIWGEVFVLPYVEREPRLAFVVETDDGRVGGYVVASADTDAFERWFRESWWPQFAERWPEPVQDGSAQDGLLRYAYSRGSEPSPYAREYPAHLHIDLLPELQRQGLGGQLIEALVAALRAAGVTGLHAVPSAANAGAARFYERLGFSEVAREANLIVFGMRL
ncbi:MAG TPA: GNAT family N-acetyltransferase [Solirubrobacteraceae bacterium]|jgi:ribosomal protein S18 acetylase RimI-like enzyme|nr:GNAT family N-acetyltransferase [Solirubrobacteraceae bacterium]